MHRPSEISHGAGAAGAAAEMRRREAEWDARGDPASLWPGLDVAALQPAADAIGRATAAILRGERSALVTDRGADARVTGVAALLSGMGPLLGYWIESGALDARDDVARLLGEHLAHGRRRAERIRLAVMPLLTRFAEEGLAPTVLKGFHTAHEYFPEPGARPFADVDILVRPTEVARAVALLTEAGFVRGRELSGEYKGDWAPPDDPEGHIESFERWDARSAWKLELHGGLVFSPLVENGGRFDMNWEARREWTRLGAPLRVLSQPWLSTALAVHASGELYNMRLLRLVEQTLVIRRDTEAGLLDWTAVGEMLERARMLRFVYPAFALVERLARGTIDARVLAHARAASTRRAREVTDGLTPTAPILSQVSSVTEKLMWADTPWRLLHRLFLMVRPPPDQPWRIVVKTYHDRLTRILAGKLVVREPAPPPDSPQR